MSKEFLYVEKYRPQEIIDTILPKGVKKTFNEFVSNQEIPNLLWLLNPLKTIQEQV